jgi:hypothetical protein
MINLTFITKVITGHIVCNSFAGKPVKPRRPTFLKALPLFEYVAQAEVFHL